MAIDLEAIRRKVSQLSGVKNSRVQLWKPAVGEHRIRVLAWPDATPDQPFKEMMFYYLGKRMPILAPFQFGKPDPINDFIKSLYKERTQENRDLAFKLRPAMRTYVPIIDRANEEQGVQVWSFGKKPYQRLLSFYLTGDIGDFTDPVEGFDLTVNIEPGKGFSKTLIGAIDAARKSSALSADQAKAKKWLESIPSAADMQAMYPIKSAEEIKSELEAYLAGDEGDGPDTSEGTSKGAEAPKDELDEIAAEVKSTKPVEEPAPEEAPKKGKGKAKKEESKYSNLDKTFDDLLNEDK